MLLVGGYRASNFPRRSSGDVAFKYSAVCTICTIRVFLTKCKRIRGELSLSAQDSFAEQLLLFYFFSHQGTAGILQLCNIARHNVVIIHVPIYHAFY